MSGTKRDRRNSRRYGESDRKRVYQRYLPQPQSVLSPNRIDLSLPTQCLYRREKKTWSAIVRTLFNHVPLQFLLSTVTSIPFAASSKLEKALLTRSSRRSFRDIVFQRSTRTPLEPSRHIEFAAMMPRRGKTVGDTRHAALVRARTISMLNSAISHDVDHSRDETIMGAISLAGQDVHT